MKHFLGFLTLTFVMGYCNAQYDTLRYRSDFRFPMDSVDRSIFLHDLNHFLRTAPNNSPTHQDLFTMPLTDELRDIQTNQSLGKPLFYKPFLENVARLSDTSYLVQVAYLGVYDSIPSLRASFQMMAGYKNLHFKFTSPLLSNTKDWNQEKINNITFIFRHSLNRSNAQALARLDSFYNMQIMAPAQQTIFIQADNFPCALQLTGVDFKSDYAGYAYNTLSDYVDDKRLVISGREGDFPSFDPHDTWHDKLRTVMPDSVINRPVDEGCAYLFGGSWGYSWQQVLDSFKVYVHKNPRADWISLYKNGNIFTMGIYPIPIANILNALLVNKIQHEKGFSEVMKLLACGRREKGDANYFMMLHQVSGISPATFNQEINTLLR